MRGTLQGRPRWNGSSEATFLGLLSSTQGRQCQCRCGRRVAITSPVVMVGSTAPMRPPNHAAIAPRSSAMEASRARAGNGRGRRLCSGRGLLLCLLNGSAILLLVPADLGARIVDGHALGLGESLGSAVTCVLGLGRIGGHGGPHGRHRRISERRRVVAAADVRGRLSRCAQADRQPARSPARPPGRRFARWCPRSARRHPQHCPGTPMLRPQWPQGSWSAGRRSRASPTPMP